MKQLIASVILSLVALLHIPAAMAASSTQVNDWTVSCDTQRCLGIQMLRDPDNKLYYTAQFSRSPDNKELLLKMSFPLGVYLPTGVGILAGESTQTIPMTVCLPKGCDALMVVDSEFKKALLGAEELKARIFYSKDQENEVSFSLMGIESVFEKL